MNSLDIYICPVVLYRGAVMQSYIVAPPSDHLYSKLLGATLSNDLTWKKHVDNIVKKASKRVYLMYQLKRAGISQSLHKCCEAGIRLCLSGMAHKFAKILIG